jgi:hypothetical protein
MFESRPSQILSDMDDTIRWSSKILEEYSVGDSLARSSGCSDLRADSRDPAVEDSRGRGVWCVAVNAAIVSPCIEKPPWRI